MKAYTTDEDAKRSSLALVNRYEPCGGIFVNGAEPTCCEVHLLPWGHARDGAA